MKTDKIIDWNEFNDKPICIIEINENLRRVELGQELTRPLRQLNNNCEFKKKYDEWCNIREGKTLERREYQQKPEVKAKAREYSQKPEVKAKAREYQQKPEVKAKEREYNQKPEVKAINI